MVDGDADMKGAQNEKKAPAISYWGPALEWAIALLHNSNNRSSGHFFESINTAAHDFQLCPVTGLAELRLLSAKLRNFGLQHNNLLKFRSMLSHMF